MHQNNTLRYRPKAAEQLQKLIDDPSKKIILNAVIKALKWMKENLAHPSLKVHMFKGLFGPNNEKIFQSYAQNRTPGAYRILWYFGPNKGEITIFAIIPHPD